MYRIEVRGNGIYVGRVYLVPDPTRTYLPVFISNQFNNYWDCYEAADAWARANIL